MNAHTPIVAGAHPEQQYLDLLADIAANGARREDRTGTGTLSVVVVGAFAIERGVPLEVLAALLPSPP